MHESAVLRTNYIFGSIKDYLMDISDDNISVLDVGGRNINGAYDVIYKNCMLMF